MLLVKPLVLLRNTLGPVAVAILAALASPACAEESAAPKAEVIWKQIGEAHGVVGMAAIGGQLFAATQASTLAV